jgi:hypothetical protein
MGSIVVLERGVGLDRTVDTFPFCIQVVCYFLSLTDVSPACTSS